MCVRGWVPGSLANLQEHELMVQSRLIEQNIVSMIMIVFVRERTRLHSCSFETAVAQIGFISKQHASDVTYVTATKFKLPGQVVCKVLSPARCVKSPSPLAHLVQEGMALPRPQRYPRKLAVSQRALVHHRTPLDRFAAPQHPDNEQ